MQRVFKLNQKAWLKSYIDTNSELRKKAKKKIWKKKCSKLMNNIKENVVKHRGMKLVTAKLRRNYLVSELNYHIIFFWQIISIRNEKNTNAYE